MISIYIYILYIWSTIYGIHNGKSSPNAEIQLLQAAPQSWCFFSTRPSTCEGFNPWRLDVVGKDVEESPWKPLKFLAFNWPPIETPAHLPAAQLFFRNALPVRSATSQHSLAGSWVLRALGSNSTWGWPRGPRGPPGPPGTTWTTWGPDVLRQSSAAWPSQNYQNWNGSFNSNWDLQTFTILHHPSPFLGEILGRNPYRL